VNAIVKQTVIGKLEQGVVGHGLEVEVCLRAEHARKDLPGTLERVWDERNEALQEHQRQHTRGIGD
jgi:hypothetical protein